jgi:putative tryptophan/tyrosine transport system substrate-binding protein
MKRREFITLLGGAAAAWPLAVRAQQAEGMRRIGVLQGGGDTDDPRSQPNVAAFLQALQQLGWTDGRNVKIDYRWPAGDPDKARKYAAELVGLAPDVILAISAASLGPLLQATRAVPIVFVAVADPVGAGFVDSLSRPGDRSGYVRFASKADVNSCNMARTARENAHPPRGRHDHSRRRDRGKSLARAQ